MSHAADIVLCTFNARYSHASMGLRCLLANLGALQPRASLLEFDLRQPPEAAADRILAFSPRIVGFGVYIWNTTLVARTIACLRSRQPDLVIVLGGPEVSHEADAQPLCQGADHVICGEGDTAFAALCEGILAGGHPQPKVIAAPPADPDRLALPYPLYTDEDIRNRTLYVEASRGCPFTCEFCLSSLDKKVRRFDLDRLLPEIGRLIERGARQLKFVDRTFNLSLPFSLRLLAFFREQYRPGLTVQVEMVPDRIPEELMESIRAFPAGALRIEAGIQTFDEQVAARISRRQDYAQTERNLRRLREETGAVIHADLIAGLPGETLAGFAAGFDRLFALRPHEIQVGLLKRLRGTPIGRHDAEWGMVYNPEPPYEVVRTNHLPEDDVAQVRRFARVWEITSNSGRFARSLPLLLAEGRSPFDSFRAWSEWLFARCGRVHALPLAELASCLQEYLIRHSGLPEPAVREAIAADYEGDGRRRLPPRLQATLK